MARHGRDVVWYRDQPFVWCMKLVCARMKVCSADQAIICATSWCGGCGKQSDNRPILGAVKLGIDPGNWCL